jgi:predicted DNA-binding protein (MmcQ/YjbR family)
MARRNPIQAADAVLRDFALTFPQATEHFPWGERAIKVKGKVFVFLSQHDGKFHVSLKLPVSGPFALTMPFAEPTGYGLGKSGWVTATFNPGDTIPVELLQEWIDESYRAVAPKTVLARLEEQETATKPAKAKPKTRRK